MMTLRFKRLVCYSFITMFLTGGIQAQALAAMVDTGQLAAEVELQQQKIVLQDLLSRADVAKQMTALGVDPADALDRVNRLTDAEVSALYDKLGSLPAGGDSLGTIALVLLILILLDVAGITDIFPKI